MYENNNEDIEFLKRKNPITEYLMDLGLRPVSKTPERALFHAPYRQDRHPSFIVYRNNNVFKDLATGDAGNIFQLLMKMNGCSFPDAVALLRGGRMPKVNFNEDHSFGSISDSAGLVIKDVKNISSWVLRKYILSRKISVSLAEKYCCQVSFLNGSRSFYAIGFRNDRGGYELRNSAFKGCSSKDITTLVEAPDKPDFLVFEGFFDFLSYKELFKTPFINAIILNSVCNIHLCLAKLKALEAKKVFVCADNDSAGKELFGKISRAYGDNAIDISGYYGKDNCKDLNEYLVNMKSVGKGMRI